MTQNYFENYITLDANTIGFEIRNLDLSFVNSLRRIIMSEVPTVGFRTEPYTKSTIKIIKNTSSLHNEFISHRIGMIPVGIKDVDNYDPLQYKYILNIKNETTEIINVTTKDINVMRLDTDSDTYKQISIKERDSFFPPDPISKDYILINRLKPDTSGEGDGEELYIEATAVVSNGKENARWSPISEVSFNNKVDNLKKATVLQQIKDTFKAKNDGNMTADEEKALEHRFNIFEVDRIYHVNEKNEPNIFEFRIESIGILNPKIIFLKAINILEKKINNFLINLTNKDDAVTIKDSKTLQNTIDIIILNEDHTLGNLIQSHFNYYDELNNKNFSEDKDNINYIGYYEPHPLDNKIVLRIGLKTGYEESKKSQMADEEYDHVVEIKKILNNCLSKIIRLCKILYTAFENV